MESYIYFTKGKINLIGIKFHCSTTVSGADMEI